MAANPLLNTTTDDYPGDVAASFAKTYYGTLLTGDQDWFLFNATPGAAYDIVIGWDSDTNATALPLRLSDSENGGNDLRPTMTDGFEVLTYTPRFGQFAVGFEAGGYTGPYVMYVVPDDHGRVLNATSDLDDGVGVDRFRVNGNEVAPTASSGVSESLGMHYEMILGEGNDVVVGSVVNDFINTTGGTDGINAGWGDDIVDGGLGSNFMTGGLGYDRFFVDGRGADGAATRSAWSTVTDFEDGLENVTLWGWQAGTSTYSVITGGAAGYEGATVHADLNADGVIDASLTLTGRSAAQVDVSFGSVGADGYMLIA